jgi:hypothetical protein
MQNVIHPFSARLSSRLVLARKAESDARRREDLNEFSQAR